MKKSLSKIAKLALATTILAVFLFSCANPLTDSSFSVGSKGLNANGDEVAVLFAGQTTPAGTVTISNDADTLYVKYEASGDWQISETHLEIATSLAGIPKTKAGSPVPGQFTTKETFSPGVKTVTYTFPLTYAVGTELVVAAHAVVQRTDALGQIVQQETGWSEGFKFVQKGNWATYTKYVVKQFTPPVVDESDPTSETAWAWLSGNATSFSAYDISRWGWTNGPLVPGTYTADLYAGAGQSDLSKGTKVGTVTIGYVNGTATITYATNPGFTMSEVHVYAGTDPLPIGQNGNYTVAPGQFIVREFSTELNTYSVTVSSLSGEIYVAAHAVVWGNYPK
jgi:hypothetical protein